MRRPTYPRLRDLPAAEREAFSRWLTGHTMPVEDPSEPREKWDWYYPLDYALFAGASIEPTNGSCRACIVTSPAL